MDEERLNLELDLFIDWLIYEQDVYIYTCELSELLPVYLSKRSDWLKARKKEYPSIYGDII